MNKMVIDDVLLNYGVDLTQKAKEGKLDKVWGRDEEIIRATHILNRKKKNNALLVGNPGVGKTSIVEGIAQKIVSKDISFNLQDKIIFNLDTTAIMAGTQYRGQMEKRLKEIIDYLKQNQNIIIFIDEIHSIVSDGGGSSGMSMNNILKPALSSGEIQCIAATTTDEARKFFDKDAAFSRRFQKIVIEDPSIEDTIKILQHGVSAYENHHSVNYDSDLIKKIPHLAKRYLLDRHLPDSAIDLLDESGSKVHIDSIKIPAEILKLESEMQELNSKKIELIKNQEWDKIQNFKRRYDTVNDLLDSEMNKIKEKRESNRPTVKEKDVMEVLSSLSKIPLNKIKEDGKVKVAKLIEELNKRVIGQEDAKKKVVKSIRRNIAGLNTSSAPIASFLMLGSTGVGKCFTGDGKVTVRNKTTGKVETISIADFKNLTKSV